MDWEVYKKVYYSYEVSVDQTRVVSMVAGQVLEQFPKKLPRGLRRPVATDLGKFIAALQAAMSDASQSGGEGASTRAGAREWRVDMGSELSRAVLGIYLSNVVLGTPGAEVDFARLLCSQELVMLFAHLDAFMADTVRIICQARPEVLKSDRQIEWAKVLSCGGWDQLLHELAERYVFEFGWLPLRKRVKYLDEHLGLTLGHWDYDLGLLEQAENIRHVIVHNGGRASQEYIDRTGRNDVAVGEFVPVTEECVAKVYGSSRMLATEVFVDVSKKFFDVVDPRMTRVSLGEEPESAPEDSGM